MADHARGTDRISAEKIAKALEREVRRMKFRLYCKLAVLYLKKFIFKLARTRVQVLHYLSETVGRR